MAFDYRKLQKYAKAVLLISIVLLILVLWFGKEVGGARRWFRIFNFSFQPSELAKLSLIIYLADFIARKKNLAHDFYSGFVPPVIVLACLSLLLILQPDFGNAICLVAIGFIILFIWGVKISNLGLCLLGALPLFYFLIFNVPYREARILAFLNPWIDPKGSGFQIVQSQIALGSGGILGLGIGGSRQKLFYLPAAHTDFIFSIIGEEMGMCGALLVIILFMLFIWQAAIIAKRSLDTFGKFLSLGILVMIALRASINIGVALGFLPTKGLPLPFISYGGTALIFDMLSVGLLLNISKSNEIL
jgi:cell division protein FtsW